MLDEGGKGVTFPEINQQESTDKQ